MRINEYKELLDIRLRKAASKQYSLIIDNFIKASVETNLSNQKNRPDHLWKCSDVTETQPM